ncbi:hypothetical protein PILCRDRAFT_826445 [Piloderma croceum F 1598]|uniref:Uncharacterized protein n=1 Tax=Piloderma croceum (strain F 1598) TaxID=765440 RepID=A0A0C3EUR8_PILCF|nr:hypothetical protein PILCRDRAFT_826445 [Piloderma croceum F 1598]
MCKIDALASMKLRLRLKLTVSSSNRDCPNNEHTPVIPRPMLNLYTSIAIEAVVIIDIENAWIPAGRREVATRNWAGVWVRRVYLKLYRTCSVHAHSRFPLPS